MRNAMFGALALVVTAALLGCGNGNGVAPPPPGNDNGNGNGNENGDPPPSGVILMQDDFFEPQLDTVTVGTTVSWDNEGNNEHTSTSDDELWDSGTVAPGLDTSHTFGEEGEFPYHCTFHGAPGQGMAGTIVVVSEE